MVDVVVKTKGSLHKQVYASVTTRLHENIKSAWIGCISFCAVCSHDLLPKLIPFIRVFL